MTTAIRAVQATDSPRSAFILENAAHVALNSIGDGVGCTDLVGNITFLNTVAERLTGWRSDDAIGRQMSEVIRIVHAETKEAIPDPTSRAVKGDRTVHLPPNSVLISRDGREVPVEDSTAPIHDNQGMTTGAVIVFRDVSDARALLEKVSHLAQHDELTGLPNRNLLIDRMTQAIGAAPRHSGQLAVMYLDLDGFKEVNDSLGHPIGDLVLQAVATALVGCVRGSDTVSRAGGDEFIVLLAEAEQPADAAIIATRMLKAVAAIHVVDGHELKVTTSIGVAVYPGDGDDAERLIKNADKAMYRVKDAGRSAFQFFDKATAAMAAVHADGALLRVPVKRAPAQRPASARGTSTRRPKAARPAKRTSHRSAASGVSAATASDD